MAVDVKALIPSRIFLDMGMLCIQATEPPYFEYVLTDDKARSLIAQYGGRYNAAAMVRAIRENDTSFRLSVPLSALKRGGALLPGVTLP